MNFLENQSINCGDKTLDLRDPIVMGIVNLTPDSFYDGGIYKTAEDMLANIGQMIRDGASIIDIGALSTRPGAQSLTSEEETDRLLDPLKLIRRTFPEIIISVDTYRQQVASVAINEGADIINDISGGQMDEEMIPFMCNQSAAYILMHIKGTPEDMQLNPQYDDVTREVGNFFLQQIIRFKQAGKENIILDPGFGFGKTVDHNYKLLSALPEYATYCYPVLTGFSRKSMINKVLGITPKNALNGTTVINTMALMKGAHILRVHDVKEAAEAIKIFVQYRNSNLIS